jgi:hypothetical protein
MNKLKMYKKISAISGAVLVSAAITFNACKKEEEPSLGDKAAEAYCDCYSKATSDMEKGLCPLVSISFAAQVKQGEEAAFKKDFEAGAKNCNPDFIWEETED